MQVAFFLPQLVQLLRDDQGARIAAFLLQAAAKSTIFAHTLICTLRVSCLLRLRACSCLQACSAAPPCFAVSVQRSVACSRPQQAQSLNAPVAASLA